MARAKLPLLAFVLLAGCVSTPTQVAVDGRTIPALNGLAMSCKDPYALTQDCSGYSGARFKVDHDGVLFKIAGSADGRIVLAMLGTMYPSRYESERLYQKVRAVAERAGARIEKVEGVAAGETVPGFVFTFDRDVYSVLRAKPQQG